MLNKLLIILHPLLERGLKISLWRADGKINVDLDTQGKSACIIEINMNKFIVYRRYNRRDHIATIEDIVSVVEGCVHGRDYFNPIWIDYIREFRGE